MDQLTTVQLVAIWILPIVFAVTLHEAAHGYVAHKFGDNTAYLQGRITANPLKHIDLVGTIILPIFLMLTTHFIFGWAKPVPVNQYNLRNPKRDFAIVALAGPFSNFLMAVFWVGLLKICLMLPKHEYLIFLVYMTQAGVMINVVLMILNLIPIPPLDGSRFVYYLLPSPWDERFNKLTPYGIVIILILIFTQVLTKIMVPGINFVQNSLLTLFQIAH